MKDPLSEAVIQKQIVEWLRWNDAFFYAIPNGEHRNKVTAARLKGQGVLAGAADLAFVLEDGRAAYIEVKTQSGKQSKHQRKFEDNVLRMGGFYRIARSLDEAMDILDEWGVVEKPRSMFL